MRAVIIAAGKIDNYNYIKSFINKTDFVICADGGYNHAEKMGINPHILIGDFDSIKNKNSIQPNTKILEYPSNKDFTDTELSINYAIENNYKEILLLAGIGNRIDHTLANILLLSKFKNVTIINENNKIYTGNDITLKEQKGTIVSLIPISYCSGIFSVNLHYELNNFSMEVGNTIGISNVMTNDIANIKIKNGILFVIVSKD